METHTETNRPVVALFDDDEANLRLYSTYFKDHFVIKGIQNPYLYEEVLKENVSAILIDVLMPVMDGIQLFEEVYKHKAYNGCPVIFISASGSDHVLKNALVSGGQDFLSRSMTKEEMILRVRNKIDFFKANRNIYILGNLKLNTSELKVFHEGQVTELTLTETKILKCLIREFPRLLTREQINEDVWPGQKVLPTTLNTHFSNLRNKFSNWEYEIVNTKGKGVQLLLKNLT